MAKLVLKCRATESQIETILCTSQGPRLTCPCCGKLATTRPYDEYDLLAEKYQISRALAEAVETFAARKANFQSLQETFMVMLKGKGAWSAENGYSPCTVTCKACHSTFRFHIHTPTVQSSPKHCIYCGSTNIDTDCDPDLDAWEVLANSYNMSVDLVKMFYAGFTAQRTILHFGDYMKMLAKQFANAG